MVGVQVEMKDSGEGGCQAPQSGWTVLLSVRATAGLSTHECFGSSK